MTKKPSFFLLLCPHPPICGTRTPSHLSFFFHFFSKITSDFDCLPRLVRSRIRHAFNIKNILLPLFYTPVPIAQGIVAQSSPEPPNRHCPPFVRRIPALIAIPMPDMESLRRRYLEWIYRAAQKALVEKYYSSPHAIVVVGQWSTPVVQLACPVSKSKVKVNNQRSSQRPISRVTIHRLPSENEKILQRQVGLHSILIYLV